MEDKPKETEVMGHPGIVGIELDEGHISRSTPEHTHSPSKKPLSLESRQELKQFVEKWRLFIDDPSLLDQPMRMVAEFFREVAIEEGLIGE
ncbi:MAG TPA: hypothetical protein ENN68_02125 [Methanomicrobia archaeon]|nr:hypothetical protein [Methanomicrobia archaeon]